MANCTILLIDYEPRSIERFRDPLVAAGYAVEIATDGVSGIEAFHRLNPDMVLVEAMIPKKHGFEVCQELKRTPHGRKTPVIITTGVYKGRKYRTQALHIYGCDEYIEKPIAPEQLLEVVGKFFVPGSSGPSARVVESERESAVGGGAPSAGENLDAIAKPAPTIVRDDTEDEIMARLDALLNVGGPATSSSATPERIVAVASSEQDPFAQMRAEIDAELGAVHVPLPFETEPKLEPMPETLPSDQVVAPSVFEALPAPSIAVPPVTPIDATGLSVEEQAGRVVSFDTKRPRKGKKAERQGKGRSPEPTQSAAAPESNARATQPFAQAPHLPSPSARAAEPLAVDRPSVVSEVTMPRGTMVASELDAVDGRRGVPVWVWAVAGLVAVVVGFVLVFGRSSSPSSPVSTSTSTSTSTPPSTTTPPSTSESTPAPTPAASAPIAASAPPELSSPPATAPKSIEPAPRASDSSKPVPVVNKAAAPKKTPERAASTTSAATAAGPRKVDVRSATPPSAPVVAPPVAQTAKPERAAPVVPQTPPDPDANVAGVESVPDSALGPPATKTAPGALIPVDLADTMPVPLTHRGPVFSTESKPRVAGTIIMNVLVNDRGTVDQVVLVTGIPGGDINDAALLAAKSWTYRPATKNGVAVKVWRSEQVVIKP